MNLARKLVWSDWYLTQLIEKTITDKLNLTNFNFNFLIGIIEQNGEEMCDLWR